MREESQSKEEATDYEFTGDYDYIIEGQDL